MGFAIRRKKKKKLYILNVDASVLEITVQKQSWKHRWEYRYLPSCQNNVT